MARCAPVPLDPQLKDHPGLSACPEQFRLTADAAPASEMPLHCASRIDSPRGLVCLLATRASAPSSHLELP